MARRITISFSEAEQHLLSWLAARAERKRRRWGISEYVKTLIELDMASAGGTSESRLAAWLAKASRCPFCGSAMTPLAIDRGRVIFYCRTCQIAKGQAPPHEVIEQEALDELGVS